MHNMFDLLHKNSFQSCGWLVHKYVYEMRKNTPSILRFANLPIRDVCKWQTSTRFIRRFPTMFCTQFLYVSNLLMSRFSALSTGPIISTPKVRKEFLVNKNGVLLCS